MGSLNKDKAAELMRRYLAGECTEEEKQLVESWYVDYQAAVESSAYPHESTRRLAMIRTHLLKRRARVRRLRRQSVLAAAVLLIFALVLPYFLADNDLTTTIHPGGNKAFLTLPDGRQIQLSEGQEGVMASVEGIRYADGSPIPLLNEWIGDKPRGEESLTITTPRGGTYSMVFADGTTVQLNAGSELTYPLHFDDHQRQVQLTGEAFFDVTHDSDRPFRVQLPGQTVEVLGTTFNTSSYPDDVRSSITLVNGSVRIVAGHEELLLVAGEQSVLEGGLLSRHAVADMEQVLAWKEGYFKFGGDLRDITKKISRWYDVEIVFGNGVDINREFVGKVSHSQPLNELLDIIAAAGQLKYTIDGRRVTLMR